VQLSRYIWFLWHHYFFFDHKDFKDTRNTKDMGQLVVSVQIFCAIDLTRFLRNVSPLFHVCETDVEGMFIVVELRVIGALWRVQCQNSNTPVITS
jgi:hypothetical protein